MGPITILYDDLQSGEKQETVSTPEELKSRLKAIGDDYSTRVRMPFGVDLVTDGGDRLSIALGQEHAVVSHFDAENIETVTAVGNSHAAGSTPFYFGDHTLIPNRFLIPVDIAWRIVDEWCDRGTLSSLLTWTSAIK